METAEAAKKPVAKGIIVRATAGRDRGGFFVVCEILDDDFVLIADGKRRKLENPKRKNIKHLALTRKIIDIEKLKTLTNAGLRRELKKFEDSQDSHDSQALQKCKEN